MSQAGTEPSLTSLDDQDKVDRAGFTRRLPNGKIVKVKPTKVNRPKT